jgi:hypothetical protein
MAVVALPNIQTVISGDEITSLLLNNQFELGEKLEAIRYIKSTDGEQSIDFSYINFIKTIMFQSEGAFTLKLVFADASQIVLPILGMFRLDPGVFTSALSSIVISTVSTTDITINIRIYGATA